jgi:RimJ/RimL family protein N-acetyltransferase
VQIVLETERMLLRRFTGADAGLLAALYGDPRVMRFITVQPPSLAEVESKILPAYLREYRELADGLGSFAAIEKATGQMAGRFSVKPASSYAPGPGRRDHDGRQHRLVAGAGELRDAPGQDVLLPGR